ncbi:hypothetical protein LN042_11740 [Kitasatospora sp. RB6PN24]|uniref:hypothetical protein n=1 Tax=Kitasatospora humi TaxID=2893891 RepID=UPI001E57AC3E|nr:hypothetical protein [Kitasatospora humi]MCC9307758.1 hypothetical protein [Kitasatospora humi]
MARTRLHPQTGEGKALLGILLLLVLEMVALAVAPVRDRPLVAGILLGAGMAGLLLLAATLHSHRRARRRPPANTPGDWYSADALEGFPMEAVRPQLLGQDAPSLNHLYTAWIMATHGHSAQWISHHLDLPPATARLLVDAAQPYQRHTTRPTQSPD